MQESLTTRFVGRLLGTLAVIGKGFDLEWIFEIGIATREPEDC